MMTKQARLRLISSWLHQRSDYIGEKWHFNLLKLNGERDKWVTNAVYVSGRDQWLMKPRDVNA
jgi:hypothetical protein